MKSALNNITKYLNVVVSGNTSGHRGSGEPGTFKSYTKSLSTYISYYTSNCVGS